jgi:hypothetical protein
MCNVGIVPSHVLILVRLMCWQHMTRRWPPCTATKSAVSVGCFPVMVVCNCCCVQVMTELQQLPGITGDKVDSDTAFGVLAHMKGRRLALHA